MMEDFKEQKTAFGYVMESRIINKGGVEESGQMMFRSLCDSGICLLALPGNTVNGIEEIVQSAFQLFVFFQQVID